MNNNNHLSAIDLGFMYTKAIIDGKRFMIKSIVGNSKELQFKGLNLGITTENDNLECELNGKKYFVSDLAILQSDEVKHSLKKNRFNSEAVSVLVSTIFGMGLGKAYPSIYTNIVSGLPVSHYTDFKDDIAKLFMEKNHPFNVSINNKDAVTGTVYSQEGKFLPQPFGAVMDVLLDDNGNMQNNELTDKTLAVIDIGFGTTDIYVINSMSPIQKLTFSTETAMSHVYNLISRRIKENWGRILPYHEIESIVQKGVYSRNGKQYNMLNIVKESYSTIATELINEIMQEWGNTEEIDQILLSGGGGIALESYLKEEFDNLSIIPDTQWAVVNGYYKFGMSKWGEQNV